MAVSLVNADLGDFCSWFLQTLIPHPHRDLLLCYTDGAGSGWDFTQHVETFPASLPPHPCYPTLLPDSPCETKREDGYQC